MKCDANRSPRLRRLRFSSQGRGIIIFGGILLPSDAMTPMGVSDWVLPPKNHRKNPASRCGCKGSNVWREAARFSKGPSCRRASFGMHWTPSGLSFHLPRRSVDKLRQTG